MSVVKINAVDLPPSTPATSRRASPPAAGAVEHSDGFEAFELLRPTASGTRYFVYTRWSSEETYEAWLNSQDFAKAHGQSPPIRCRHPHRHPWPTVPSY